jgi:hydrogenase maturation protease
VASAPVVVIGVGNTMRADDAAGILVARRLRTRPGVEIREQSGEATALIDALRGSAAALIVDAASGAEPGRLHRLDAAAEPLPQGLFGVSTHGFGVAEGIELARALGALPPVCVVYAVEAARFETGAPMSEAVARALPALAEKIAGEIETFRHTETRDA